MNKNAVQEQSTMEDLKATASQKLQSRSVALVMLDTILIFISLLLIYSLTYSGTFRIDDEHILVARAQSLAFWNHIQYPQVYGNDRVRHLSTISEEAASPIVAIEPGQAYLGSLLYKFASAADLGGVQAYFTLNLYATALTGALVYLCVFILGFRRRTAIICAFLFGLGTMAWPYSKTAFRDPLAACMVTLAVLGWVLMMNKPINAGKCGFFIFLFGIIASLFFKSNTLVFLPAFFISAVILAYLQRKNTRLDKRQILLALLPFILLIALSFSVTNPGPLSRFSISYYIEMFSRYIQEFNTQTLLAALGPFFSPSKSLFLFNPIFLLIPWVIIWYGRNLHQIVFPTLLSTFFLAVFQAIHLREHWAGTLVWGLRFMLPAIPLFSILLAPWIEEFILDDFNRKKRIAWFFIGFSVLIQLSGAIVAWQTPFKAWLEKGLDPYALGSIWRLEYLVIPEHLRAFFEISSWDIAWIRTFQTNWLVVILPILALSLIILAVIYLWKWFRMIRKDRFRSGLALSLLTIAIFLPIFPSLWLLKADPSSGGDSLELEQVIEWTKAEAREGDLIVVDSYGTDLWQRMMNDWDRPIAWYSLPYEIPGAGEARTELMENPSHAALELFGKLGDEYSRLIYLTSQETPDFALGREERWLNSNHDLEKEVEFVGDTLVKGSVFSPY